MHADKRALYALIAPLLLVLIAGCGDMYMSDATGMAESEERTLELVASPDNVDISGGGAITILVHVTFDNGRPVANGAVLLTSTLGTLGASELTTDDDGIASTTLAPGDTTGWAVVVATHKFLQASVEVSFYETGDTGQSG